MNTIRNQRNAPPSKNPGRTDAGPHDVAAVRHLLLVHIDSAVARIEHGSSMSDLDVHEARKSIKRARAILKLLRPSLTARSYALSKDELRDAGRALAAVRDARVIADRFDEVLQRSDLPRFAVSHLAARLHAEATLSRRARSGGARDPVSGLTAARKRLARISLPARNWAPPGAGFRAIYRSGREAMPKRAQMASAAAMHEFRKQVKSYWHALEAFAPVRPTQIGRTIKSAKRLADLLGEDHDLALLADKLRTLAASPDESVRTLLDAIELRQRRLRRKALKIGAALYEKPPVAMTAQLGRDWQKWRNSLTDVS
jgi:CHAD domain-containing protein